jgi:aldehyde dehydrogenase (NAD+)
LTKIFSDTPAGPKATPHPIPLSTRHVAHSSSRFINNEFVKGVDGKTFEVINPSNEKVICSVHEASEKDVDIAVAAARKAFEGDWSKVTPEQRGKYLVKLADLMERDTDLLAAVESLDNGKAFALAKGDLALACACIRYYGGWADKIEGKVLDMNPDTFTYTRQEPVRSSVTDTV